MKKVLLLIGLLTFTILGCTWLSAATLLSQNFSTTTFPPTGWTVEGPQPTAWMLSPSNFAGGAINEAKLHFDPSGYGTYRLISPPIDTRKVHDMTLSFRHMFDHYDTQEFVSIAVELAHDTESFDWELWYLAPTGDIAATQVSVPISFDLGMSETTYISFVFRGNNWNINAWYIDDIVLTYNNTLGSGTWETGEHYPVGDLIVPNGHTLTLQAGTTLYFNSGKQLSMQGRLLVNGTESQPVTFTAPQMRDYWNGIKFNNVNTANDSTLINHAIIEYCSTEALYFSSSSKTRISNSEIRYNFSSSSAVVYMYYSNAIIEGCDIYENSSTYCPGIHIYHFAPVIRNNRFYYNTSTATSGTVLYLDNCSASNIYGNQVSANYFTTGGYGVRTYAATGTFKHNQINNNQYTGLYVYSGSTTFLTVENCDIAYNGSTGYYNYSNTTTMKNNIIWGNGSYAIYNQQSLDHINISYCCLNSSSTYQVITSDITNCIYTDPQFVNPPTGSGTSTWNDFIDWHLQDFSPCIDTGDPASPPDADLSRADIGMFPRALKPLLTRATDVPFDQGRKLYLRWNRSDIDKTFYPNAYYSVWRWNTTRTEDRYWVSNPAQLDFSSQNLYENVSFRDGNRTWDYLGVNVPAINLTDYGVNVETEQDSSSTGTHTADYMIVYQNNNGFWMSVPMSGYSVDNIPPYAPARLNLTNISANQFNLTWDEVTEGVWEGNSYPEVNLITYKIYAGDSPDFEINQSTYLMSTTDPYALLNNQTQNRRFFKIIATDSE